MIENRAVFMHIPVLSQPLSYSVLLERSGTHNRRKNRVKLENGFHQNGKFGGRDEVTTTAIMVRKLHMADRGIFKGITATNCGLFMKTN